ncbi:MAG TPA: YitT family protein [Bacteroidia bacterium]|nr:YitT family protein [Bacteroidia bacterium]
MKKTLSAPVIGTISRKLVSGEVRGLLLMLIGVLSASFGLKGFVLPNEFLDGGVTGISLLVSRLTGWSLPVLIVVINLPFILLAVRQFNVGFAIKTFGAICLLAACVAFLPFEAVTSDRLLVSVFGGFFLGLGIGLCIRGGCVIDGTEVLAVYTGRKSGLSIGDVILIMNVVIFSVAAFKFGLETSLYSMLIYFSASKAIDFVVHGIEEHTGVTIVSVKSDAIREMIIDKMGRGVTIFVGKGGYGKHGKRNDIDVVYTVITRLEIARLKNEIEQIDEHAFIIYQSINDTSGGMVKKRPLQ